MTDEEIMASFDGDFGEVEFDHKPTPDDILLIKLKLVASAASKERVDFYEGEIKNLQKQNKILGQYNVELGSQLALAEDKLEKEKLKYNPDYLDYQKGVETGRKLAEDKARELINGLTLDQIAEESEG